MPEHLDHHGLSFDLKLRIDEIHGGRLHFETSRRLKNQGYNNDKQTPCDKSCAGGANHPLGPCSPEASSAGSHSLEESRPRSYLLRQVLSR